MDSNMLARLRTVGFSIVCDTSAGREQWYVVTAAGQWGGFASPTDALVEGVAHILRRYEEHAHGWTGEDMTARQLDFDSGVLDERIKGSETDLDRILSELDDIRARGT
jgi:hypothetical protein